MKNIVKMSKFVLMAAFNRFRTAQFAVTNRCNGKCMVCSIWQQKTKISVSKEDGLRVIDKLARMGVVQITFTGGEPLMNPHIFEFIRRAQERIMFVGICVGDPRLLTEKTVKRLNENGPVLISMSFDTTDPALNAQIRGIPDIHSYFLRAIELVKGYNITLVAAPTITEYTWDKIPEIIDAASEMGFSYINISYPTKSLSKTFQIGGEGTSLITLSPEQIMHGLQSLVHHMESNNNRPFVINPVLSVKNMIKFLKDPKSIDFPCFGGWKVFAIDWNCDVYPCWRSDRKIGNILDPDFTLVKSEHNACTMSWFRDFSVIMQDGGQTVLRHLFDGNIGKFLRLLQ